ncbi:Glutamate receptor ionotropic, kainate 5 [Halotydeus destructor]|nr:Glutamate receptor ionotropic, kainate 5 [Halotydeus destructor]
MKTGGERLLLDFIVEYFNFTVDPINCNRTYGKLVNGSWTGLVGQLVYRKADFCLSYFSLIEARYSIIDFSVPYTFEPVTFMVNTKFAYLAPEERSVFDMPTKIFFATLLTFFVAFVLIGRQMQAVLRIRLRLNIFWTCLLNFLQKGVIGPEMPQSETVRLLASTWLFVGLFVMAMMGGFVLSLLSDVPLNRMDTLAKLEASTVRPMVTKGSYLQKAMQDMSNPDIHALGTRLVESEDADFTDTQRQLMHGARFALFQSKGPLKCGQKKLNERLIYVPPESPGSTVFSDMLAIGFQKGSSLKPLFDPV